MTDDKRRRSKAAPAGFAAVLALLLGGGMEGRKHLPYYDQAGVLTVCGGITGPEVIKGKWYGWGECDALEQRFISRMTEKMGPCVGEGLNPGEWKAWGHFTYNVGITAFCKSTAAKRLQAGDHIGACKQMPKWTWITKPGRGLVNCRIKAENCNGIPKRRDFEYQMCMDAQA